jgi:hypothetical protein
MPVNIQQLMEDAKCYEVLRDVLAGWGEMSRV